MRAVPARRRSKRVAAGRSTARRARPLSRAAGREPRRAGASTAARRRGCSPRPGCCGTDRFTAVHATHLTDDDIGLLADAGVRTACFCPTTERDLADGIGPARRARRRRASGCRSAPTSTPSSTRSRRSAGWRCTSGCTSNERGRFTPGRAAADAAAANGYRSPGLVRRRRDRRRRARRLRRRAAPTRSARRVPSRTRSSTRNGVRRRPVVVGGARGGRATASTALGDGRALLREAARPTSGSSRVSTCCVTGIGELVTCDGALGRRSTTQRSWSAPTPPWSSTTAGSRGSGPRPRRRPPTATSTSVGGPSSRGSSTPTPTSSSPATGPPSSPHGWPARPTTAAASGSPSPRPARRATTSCAPCVAARVAEMRPQGTTTVEVKSGYGLTVEDEARLAADRRRGHRPRRPSSGRTSCRPSTRRPRAQYLELVTGPMLAAARRTPGGSTSSASRVGRTRSPRTRRGPCSRPGGAPGWACGCTATSSATARASQLAVELGAASVDHCTYLSDADVDALVGAAARPSRRCCPGVEFSTRSPYPDARRAAATPGSTSRSPPTATRAPATRPRCRSSSPSRCARWG